MNYVISMRYDNTRQEIHADDYLLADLIFRQMKVNFLANNFSMELIDGNTGEVITEYKEP